MAIFDRVDGPIDMRVRKGRRFENILKWTRSGRRLETGRRSESIIYIEV
jgi:hypothetical protein